VLIRGRPCRTPAATASSGNGKSWLLTPFDAPPERTLHVDLRLVLVGVDEAAER